MVRKMERFEAILIDELPVPCERIHALEIRLEQGLRAPRVQQATARHGFGAGPLQARHERAVHAEDAGRAARPPAPTIFWPSQWISKSIWSLKKSI